LRQDSGDPFVFASRAKEVYEQLGITPSEKLIVYSDSLNVEKAIALKKQCDELGLSRGFPFF
jgi:nicotinate phosphoribosyltransferase